jgi:PAS domain S-box-containing protein
MVVNGGDAVIGLLASPDMAVGTGPRSDDRSPDRAETALAAEHEGPPRAVLLAAVVVVGLIGLVLASDLPQPLRRVTSGVALVTSGLALTAACLVRSRRSAGRRRRAWALFGLAALASALGNVWLTVVDLAELSSARRIGDALILVAVALVLVGLFAYPFGRRGLFDLVRLLLDAIVLGGSILLILGNTVLPQITQDPSLATLALVLAPVIDIVMATVIWLLMLRARPRDRLGMALAAAGFVLFSVSEVTAAIARARGDFEFGTVVDLGWIAGYTVLAIAIRWSPSSFPSPPEDAIIDRSPVAGTLVMFAVFVSASVLTVSSVAQGAITVATLVLLGAVLVAILVRQVLLLVDNDRLRTRLEQRVIERSTELAEVTQRTDLMVNAVEDGVYGVDSQGRVSFVNPAGARLLAVRRSLLLGHSAHQTFHSHAAEDCYLRTIQRTGLALTGIEDSYRTADGREMPVEVSASPLVEGTGVRGVVVVFRDVTRRREVDRLKNEFVSLVSHELKTPLTAIRGSLGLLAGGALGELAPPATRMIEIAMESSERLTRLINEILDMERIESGAVPMDIGPYPTDALLAAAQDQVQVLAADAGVSVHLGRAEGTVLADPDRVVQTLINLIGNAIKFSPPGSEVRLEAVREAELMAFRVSDRGRGIPASRLDVIFERFEQVDSSDAREKGGTGLGLAISRSIVERLGGRIWAENNPAGGATFTFTLPVPTPAPDQEELTIEAVAPAPAGHD